MKVLVDTCVWSMAVRRKKPEIADSVHVLEQLIKSKNQIFLSAPILQEVLQGLKVLTQRQQAKDTLTHSFPILIPSLDDYVCAAELHTLARSHGLTLGTVDCLVSAQCIASESYLLTDDKDFAGLAKHSKLKLLPKIKVL
jgi:predicted nucleic acid-binding protein